MVFICFLFCLDYNLNLVNNDVEVVNGPTSSLRDKLADEELYGVPEIIPGLSSKRVLTTELVTGIPINHAAELHQDERNLVNLRLSTRFKHIGECASPYFSSRLLLLKSTLSYFLILKRRESFLHAAADDALPVLCTSSFLLRLKARRCSSVNCFKPACALANCV